MDIRVNMSKADISQVTDQLAKTKVDVSNELSFKGRGLKLNTAADAEPIIKEIEKCTTMTALRMEGNTLGVDAAEAISKSLQKHPEFRSAYWSDMFTGRLKTEIPPALKHLGAAIMAAGANLVELDLSDNAFGPNGVVGLVDLLKSASCYSLQELKLNNNGLGIGGGKMLAECLTECHKNSLAAGKPLSLKVFISGRNRLENEGATALAQTFKNGINHPGITALANAFAANKNLKIINLNDNTFSVIGAKNMAKVLSQLQNLEVINFGDCLVRTEGAKALAEVLTKGHKNLVELNLSGNEINQAGANAVAEAMENKDKLEKLDLDCNELGEEGVEIVKATMEAMGKTDALASLSGDEGSADEDEEHGEIDDSQEDEDAKDETEGEVIDDPELQTVSAKDFLAFPSPSKLQHMGKDRAAALKAELGNDIKDVEKTVQTFMRFPFNKPRLSSIVTLDDDKTKESVYECADELFQEMLKSDSEDMAATLANSLLVHFGCLKSEDKKIKPPTDVTGPLVVSHPSLDKSPKAKHKFLQTLYSF
ncbi:hypothetical protein KUTeg_024383 [Tegillarca granosa]|uniref:Ran-GTPase activating protein 1 C-terminal domain-containing protein n=1 Tax=Tegillarca granosa TaxID=220873 RepID=A0ABQ9E2P9_TEGGR|nr:hypothetical protein KUTeg_024383 [Tegillarca granosa]